MLKLRVSFEFPRPTGFFCILVTKIEMGHLAQWQCEHISVNRGVALDFDGCHARYTHGTKAVALLRKPARRKHTLTACSCKLAIQPAFHGGVNASQPILAHPVARLRRVAHIHRHRTCIHLQQGKKQALNRLRQNHGRHRTLARKVSKPWLAFSALERRNTVSPPSSPTHFLIKAKLRWW